MDTIIALTAIGIKNAGPHGKAYKLADIDSLYLLVKPNGVKLWRMNYRHLNRQKTLAFGIWPDVTLAEARAKREKRRDERWMSRTPNRSSRSAVRRLSFDFGTPMARAAGAKPR